ncbi:MAG: SH3 domain-containing protein [Actinomycetota bacterium]
MSRRAPRSRNALSVGRFLACLVAVTALVVGTVVPVTAASATVAPATAEASSATSADLARSVGEGADTSIRPATLVGFNPGNIISDAMFAKKGTMSESKIQSFLNSKVTNCRSGYVCLKSAKDRTRSIAASPMCNAYNGGGTETAARIIYKVAQACGINPQVLLVMLEKEQGLVTHTWPSDWRYTIAMGQGCPDTAACDTRYYGFFNQLYGAASQLKRYENPPGTSQFFTWYAPGKTWNLRYHPNASCGSSPVYIRNQATSNLYYYTPYQPNSASLKAGTGTGNSCSSYGNRNFYHFFTSWFGSTQASESQQCAPPNGGTRVAHRAYVVETSGLSARIAPRAGCTKDVEKLAAETIVQASRISGSGDWLKVRTQWGERWVARAHVRIANAEESECSVPSGTSTAKFTYTLTKASKLRLSPRSGCNLDSETLSPEMVVTATSVSNSGYWLKVASSLGEGWVHRGDTRRATVAEAVCAYPPLERTAKYGYVVAASTSARVAPNSSCSSGADTIARNTPVQAVGAVDGWLRVAVGTTTAWIDRSDTRRATTAEASCIVPADVSLAKRTYVLESDVTGRMAPRTSCSTGATGVSASTVVKATAVTASGSWLKVDLGTSEKWIPRDDVRYATATDMACTIPSNATGAKYSYVITASSTAARTGPGASCATDASVTRGQAVQAVAAVDGWLKVIVGDTERWVKRADTRRATTAEAACVIPAGIGSAKLTYVVTAATTARTAPDTGCAAGSVKLAKDVAFAATGVTADGDWLRATHLGKVVWVPRDAVRKATTEEMTCPQPTDTRPAKKTYVVTDGGVTARTAPSTTCTTGASTLAAGSVVAATAVTADGTWLKVAQGSGTPKWVPRDSVRYATTAETACLQPTDASSAKLWYSVATATTARLAPTTSCSTGTSSLAVGTVVQATALSADGAWLRLRIGSDERWVLRADLEKAPSATTTAGVNLRKSASTSAASLGVIPSGTIVAVLRSSGDWSEVQTALGTGWMHSDYLR